MPRGLLAVAAWVLTLGAAAAPAGADVVAEQIGVETYELQGDGEGDVIVLATNLGKIVYFVNGAFSDDWVPEVDGSQTVSSNGTAEIRVFAGGGDDTFIGLGIATEGPTEIRGEGGGDMLLAGPSRAFIEGGAGDDFIGGGGVTGGSVNALGEGGDDVFHLGSGDDVSGFDGGPGADRAVITGDTNGPDTLDVLAEDDRVVIAPPSPVWSVRVARTEAISVRGSGGDDVITIAGDLPGDPALTLDGGPDSDTLTGGASGENLLGGDGEDTLSGAGGAGDRLDGGNHRDALNGGPGKRDSCDGGPARDVRPAPGCETLRSIP